VNHTADIAIVGAGAAGLAAAIFAGEAAAGARRIVLIDGAAKIGAKILVSGGGRCNVTHDHIRPEDYHGSRNIVRNILRAFDEQATVRWFESLGVDLKREDTGKLFPVTDSARNVLDALTSRCRALGVELRTACRITRITPTSPDAASFTLHHEAGCITAPRLILATGGRSLPKTGSDGQGWALARRLGHTVTDTHTALVPLVLDEGFFHAKLAGISHEVQTTVTVAGKPTDRRTGSLLWTHFGISGPVAMDASRMWTHAHDAGHDVAICLNFCPGESFDSIERLLIDAAQRQAQRPVTALLAGRLPKRVAEAVAEHLGVGAAKLGQLSRDRRRQLAHGLVALPLPVTKHRGWNYAEVTAGGVPLDEIDYRTMASRRCEGLYLAGEMLDVDGRIGGFNFQWAWATGHLAGRAAAGS
jgi:predicted Rossmann fold flavoprotein